MKYMQNLSLHEYNPERKFKDLDLLKKKKCTHQQHRGSIAKPREISLLYLHFHYHKIEQPIKLSKVKQI